MKKSNILFVCLLVCSTLAEIIDEKNMLDSAFLQYWNRTLEITEAERFVKVTVNIYGEEKQKSDEEADDLETLKLPEITITYNDTAGFEIFQSNFENFPNDSNFIIPSMIFNDIVPEANALFKDGKTIVAAEYVLINILETLYSPKMTEDIDEFAEESGKTANISNKTLYFYAIPVVLIVFLFVIIRRKKKQKTESHSYLFNGMSKTDFFGGGFDKI
jgi:hypothetical protein